VCAGSNPPFVFTILRFAAYLNLVQVPLVLFGFAPYGADFHSFSGNLRFCHHRAPGQIFSVPLPTISDYPSPDHISCMEGGVSSAVAAFRAPAHTMYCVFNLI